MKVISISLWGNKPQYCYGAIENVKLAKKLYPNWKVWVYCGRSVPSSIVENLNEFDNCKVIIQEKDGDWTGMFWRFLPASNPDVEVMISRDCDSRLTKREKNAVDEWLHSNKSFHIIRDHPQHNTEILGGMWGVKNPALLNMKDLIDDYNKGDFWQVDQNFLRDIIYPIIKDDCFVHDEFFLYEEEKKNISYKRRLFEFIGESIDENNNINKLQRMSLYKYYRKNTKSKLKKIVLVYWKIVLKLL